MSARGPAEAVERYRQSLQRVLSCVTDGVLSVLGYSNGNPYQPSATPHALLLQAGQFVPLTGASSLALRVAFRYEIAQQGSRSWLVRTREYTYSIARTQSGKNVEFITWHWQPGSKFGRVWPHLHVGPGIAGSSQQIGSRFVHRVHVPTHPVPLSSVVRMTIEELDVRPLRDDWDAVLEEQQAT